MLCQRCVSVSVCLLGVGGGVGWRECRATMLSVLFFFEENVVGKKKKRRNYERIHVSQ